MTMRADDNEDAEVSEALTRGERTTSDERTTSEALTRGERTTSDEGESVATQGHLLSVKLAGKFVSKACRESC
jgi:hypothetical protein